MLDVDFAAPDVPKEVPLPIESPAEDPTQAESVPPNQSVADSSLVHSGVFVFLLAANPFNKSKVVLINA